MARLSGLRLFRRALGPRGLLLRDKLTFLLGVSMMWWGRGWAGVSGGCGAVRMGTVTWLVAFQSGAGMPCQQLLQLPTIACATRLC